MNTMSLITAESPVIRLLNWSAFSKAEELSGISAQIMSGQETKSGSTNVQITSERELVAKFARAGRTFNKEAIDAEIQALDALYSTTPKMYLARQAEKKKISLSFKTSISAETTDDLFTTPDSVISPILLSLAGEAISIPDLEPTVIPERTRSIDDSPPRPPENEIEIPIIRKGKGKLPIELLNLLQRFL